MPRPLCPTRYCRHPDCGRVLASDNVLGVCHKHRDCYVCKLCGGPRDRRGRSTCRACHEVVIRMSMAHDDDRANLPQPAGQETRIAVYADRAARREPLFQEAA